MPFSAVIPNAVQSNTCGVCGENRTLKKYGECKSLDSGYAELYICTSCFAIYNSTAETQEMDVLEWQKRWAEDPNFYKVPTGEEFDHIIDQYDRTFEFFQDNLNRKHSGTYLEIGAGSGVMAASALNFFDDVYVFDHVQERLKITQGMMGADRYHIADTSSINAVKADMILIWHALEHFLTPGKVFKMCGNLLKDDGLVVIQVPMLSLEHVYPGHYYFYNELALSKMAENSGLKAIKFFYDHAMNAMTGAFIKSI